MKRLGPTRSLARETHNELRAAIEAGEFADSKIPPEAELADHLGVSRTTVRAALQMLEQQGIVSRQRGVGTRVVPHGVERSLKVEFNRLTALDELLTDGGHELATEILDVRTEVLPTIAETVGLSRDEEWHVVEKIWYTDALPAVFLRDHIPTSVIATLPSDHVVLGSIFRIFTEHGPAPIAFARTEFVPRLVDNEVASHLKMKAGAPYVRVWQRHHSIGHRFLAISQLDVNDELRILFSRRVYPSMVK